MGRKYLFLIAFLLLCSMKIIGFIAGQAHRNASLEFPAAMPLVFVDPQNASIHVAETLTVEVKIFNLTDTYYGTDIEWHPGDEELGPPGGILFNYSLGNLYGFDVQFSWNPTVLQYVSHTARVPVETYADGVLHEPTQKVKDDVDEVAGTYWLAQSSKSPAPLFNRPDANSTVFTMTFEVIRRGASALSIDSVDLATTWFTGDTHRTAIPHVVRSGWFKTPALATSIEHLSVRPQVDGASFELPAISGENCLVRVAVRNYNLTLADTYNLTLHYDESLVTVWENQVLNPDESKTHNYTIEAAYLSVGSHNINATAAIQHADEEKIDHLSESFIVIDPPELSVEGPDAVMPGQPAYFDASQSTHPSGTILNYSWFLTAPGESLPKFLYEGISFAHIFAETAKNGTWRVVLKARDNFGLTYNASRPATVHYIEEQDLEVGTQLEIVILWPENGSFQGRNVPLIVLANAATSWIGYSLDNGANVTITGNTTMFGLSDGYHHLTAYANNSDGHMWAHASAIFTVDTISPNITAVYQFPPDDEVQPDDKVFVFATIIDESSGVKQAMLNWTTNNGTWSAKPMASLEENSWYGTIPQYPQGSNITYIITAKDYTDNTVTTEDFDYECAYVVIPEYLSVMILPPFITATLLAAIAYRRKSSTR